MARIGNTVGTTRGFSSQIRKWAKETEERAELAYRTGVQDFVDELYDTTPVDTGLLRDSMLLSQPVASLKMNDRIQITYTTDYARRMEMGFTGYDSLGRYYDQAGRWWIKRAGARYVSIMRAAATRLFRGG